MPCVGTRAREALTVTDTYYVPPGQANRIYRHRIDKEIQQLTLKSRGGDNEVRTEINWIWVLPAPKLTRWRRGWVYWRAARIRHVKEIRVFDFPIAKWCITKPRTSLRVCCVEFEAKYAGSEEEGWPPCSAMNSAWGLMPTTARR